MITVLNLVEEMYKNTRSKRWCKQRIEELRCVHFLVQERSTICFEKHTRNFWKEALGFPRKSGRGRGEKQRGSFPRFARGG